MSMTSDKPMGIEKLNRRTPAATIADPKIVIPAIWASVKKLDPRHMAKNPVMFVVEIVATLTTVLFIRDLAIGAPHLGFALQINLWLWFTVVFANFAEAVAEGRGKAQAAALRQTKTDAAAKLLGKDAGKWSMVPATQLKPGDVVLVEAGDLIPSDGDVIEGVASVNEAAITGESAPVIRESGGDRSAVTGGTQVISDWIKVRITAAQGHTFLDRMIALVEGAERQKTPNEIALNILLAGLTIIFVFAVASIPSFAAYAGGSISVLVLVALFVTLIPTTIGALLSAIGIAGMDRLVRFNVLAMSGRAVEAAGDVDTLLLDKTGTITLGNRQATEFLPIPGVDARDLADAAQLSSLLRRDAGGPLHRRAGEGEIRHPRPRDVGPPGAFHPVHRPDPHQRHRRRRLLDPQGRGRRGARLCPRPERASRPAPAPSERAAAARSRRSARRPPSSS
ncbi:MAG: HAD-IC family P-type ATPase [Rhizomicrobium sp.]